MKRYRLFWRPSAQHELFSFLAVAIIVALSLAGCGTEPRIGAHTFLHEPRQAKPPGSRVDIYTNGLPSRAFERVAILDGHYEQQAFTTPSLKHIIPVLEDQARAAGCDAIIEIQEAKPPPNWTLETRVKHYTGVGIVYK
jgi:hypothetical protein